MSPELAEQKQIEAYRAMTGEQRLAIGLRLHELSCEITREAIRSQNPSLSPSQVEEKPRERIQFAYSISPLSMTDR